jgi:catechol 2,3-dioxygenase-like lactoylglutathione lyase family enzyme
MRFEHFALNVPDPVAQGDWYVRHLGFSITRQFSEPPYMRFLADGSGRVIVELYHNPNGPVPDYPASHPLAFHLALVSEDARAERARLESAGATFVLEDELKDGTVLVMLRDPWGVPLQLCQRSVPFPMPSGG